ncbi:Stk1 family PASTA domain-containing Ser/Thr kinase [Nocardioides sp. HM23]|uniref:Stk1 family PASTA domain-containing Ser/Thr kinase n=1 Tax=Nocardioides bizhenqiangii TaxID=3095076 RepID=UPI002ACA6BEE|nr:Stk1 family PASTA domain-containing Ser/Thr kinase [Nocardioides sp. HM23]MDZ5619323.1 Stk1 family PASTA domain-containing Ser/Thr kinase [Nocardioides sp. HM23]
MSNAGPTDPLGGNGTGSGTVGGRYQLGELLGRGGMAEVRKGIDARLGRVVAVKRLRTDLASDATFQARFRREAQSSASLNHPAIVAVYDTGEEPAGDGVAQPYIVMEFVAGRTLRDILREGRKILPERALEITSGVLSALDYSHRAGIIHRDIKPGNVMLTPSGDVKVMDFGIARAISDAASSMTQTAAVVGTAQYLSPEQARGESVDSRSDVYSAGCLLYELLTGRPPFVGDSPVAVAYQHVREPAVPPSHHDADLTPDIDVIVMKALAKRVEDRYQSAAQMRADIERYLAGRPVAAVLPTPIDEPPTSATAVVAPANGLTDTSERQRPVPPADRRDDGGRKPWLWVVLGLLVLALLAAAFFAWPKLFPDEPTDVQVPSVVGFERDRARELLADEGLAIDDKQRQCDDQYDAGQVVDQDPPGDEYVAPGSEVTLVLSSGPCDFAMPDVTGKLQRIAIEELVAAGIKRKNILTAPERCDTDEPAGTVVEQTPEPQASVGRDDSVTLCVSDGPEVVPDVIGLRQGQAERLILEAGFQVDVLEDASSEAPKGEVTNVIPGEGEEVDQGKTVTIFVSIFEEPTTSAPPPETDTDDDGLSDTDEATLGTDPENPDSDGDTFSDGDEVEAGSNPLDPLSFPPPGDGDGDGND